jgi:hypothetical protein
MKGDAEYFTRRFREEQQAALSADKRCVRLRHLEFAQAYELRARELRALDRQAVLNVQATGSYDGPLNAVHEQIPVDDEGRTGLQLKALDAEVLRFSRKHVG